MKTYLNPEISVVNMDSCDVIATSGASTAVDGIKSSSGVNATSFAWLNSRRQ